MKVDLARKFYNASGNPEFNQPFSERSKKITAKVLPMLKEHLFPKANVLEIGCGNGRFMFECEKLGADISGIDCADQVLESAKEFATKIGSKAKFILGDAVTLENINETFDVVLLLGNNIVEYSYQDFETICKAIYSKLNANGKFIIQMKNDYRLTSVSDEKSGLIISYFDIPNKGVFEYHSHYYTVAFALYILSKNYIVDCQSNGELFTIIAKKKGLNNMKQIINDDLKFILNTYNRFPVVLKSGKGSIYKDISGKRYIDFSSGIAVNSLGAADRKWNRQVKKQLKLLAHTSNLYYTIPQVELAKTLCQKTGASKVFFSNSGAESNECAIKAARKYSFDKYGQHRYEIISLVDSFHGRTMSTLSATGQSAMHPDFFTPYLDGFLYAKPNDIADLERLITNKTAAVLIELIQGESGVNPLDKSYVKALKKLCDDNDILLIIDEVQTGNGRTGNLYAFEDYGITPDIMTTAKGLAGGLPLGATLFFGKTEKVLEQGHHGSTFGGNPVCCAAANYVLSTLTSDFLNEVKAKGEYITKCLKEFSGVKSISGAGLMIGIETEKAKEKAVECLKKGLIVLTAKQKIRLLPPLNISYKHIDKGLEILGEVLK